MRYTEEEIKRFAEHIARQKCDGCSKAYNEIKQSLIDQLREANGSQDG